jgi:hypothetical protein
MHPSCLLSRSNRYSLMPTGSLDRVSDHVTRGSSCRYPFICTRALGIASSYSRTTLVVTSHPLASGRGMPTPSSRARFFSAALPRRLVTNTLLTPSDFDATTTPCLRAAMGERTAAFATELAWLVLMSSRSYTGGRSRTGCPIMHRWVSYASGKP